MNATPPGIESRIILPRWRTVSRSLGELRSARGLTPQPGPFPPLDEAIAAFENDPGLFTAGDLVGQALVSKQHDAQVDKAAELIRDLTDNTKQPIGLLVGLTTSQKDLLPDTVESWRTRVRQTRAILVSEPRNAVRWSDLGLSYAALGQLEAAERSTFIARSLAPENRFVMRGAARLAALTGTESVIRQAIAGSDAKSDPWLIAAELGLAQSEGKPPFLAPEARDVIRRGNFHPYHLSELRAALGTHELSSGSRRKADALLRGALLDPTENALAQVEWSRTQGSGIRQQETLSFFAKGDEAASMMLAAEGRFPEAVERGRLWHQDQPFAVEPAKFLSWIGVSAIEDLGLAASAARRGLSVQPDDWILRNNLTVALALEDRVEEAERELAMIDPRSVTTDHAGTAVATRGLVEFRKGNVDTGRLLYLDARAHYVHQGNYAHAAIAALFHAREELLAGTSSATATAAEGLRLAAKVAGDPVIDHLQRTVKGLLVTEVS